MSLSYRPATPADFEFFFRLHEAAMRAYVEEAYGPWDADWQRTYFRETFDPALLRVIQWNGQDAGMLHVQERSEELFLVDIEILPAFQRRGIGTQVLRSLIAEAERQGKPVALQVLRVNHEARKLYERLGFRVTGEKEKHYLMAYEVQGKT